MPCLVKLLCRICLQWAEAFRDPHAVKLAQALLDWAADKGLEDEVWN